MGRQGQSPQKQMSEGVLLIRLINAGDSPDWRSEMAGSPPCPCQHTAYSKGCLLLETHIFQCSKGVQTSQKSTCAQLFSGSGIPRGGLGLMKETGLGLRPALRRRGGEFLPKFRSIWVNLVYLAKSRPNLVFSLILKATGPVF